MAAAESDIARAAKLPDWSAEVSYAVRGPTYANMVSLMFSIDLPWSPGTRQEREYAARLKERDAAREMREDTLRMRRAEVESMRAEWEAARIQAVRIRSEMIPLAVQRREAALAAYRGGTGMLAAVLEARRAELDVQLALVQQEQAAARAWAWLNFVLPRGGLMNAHRSSQRGASLVAIAAVVAVAIAAAGAGYWYGTRHASPAADAASGAIATAPAATTAAADPGERKVLYWHDPMVPGQRFDKPGRSPFMDMDLVPVYADAGADEGQVSISPRLVQNFGIRTAEAREGTLDTGFSAVGAVGIDERGLVAVQSRSPGYVERLHVRAQYDVVAAGAPLLDLYVPDWLAAEEELLALKASVQPGTAALADAARQRLRLLGVPEAEIARVERDGKPSARITVTAPQAGIVWEIGARDGMAVMPGTTLFRLAGIGTVWVIAEVPEAQAALVRVGAPVEARAAAYPDRAFKGSVNALLPEVNAATRTVRARIVLANPGGALKPGMFTTVAFGGAAAKPGVVVPAEAVIRTGKRNVVIVDAGQGRFAPVEVEVGPRERRSRRDPPRARGRAAGRGFGSVPGRFRGESQGGADAAGRRRRAGGAGPGRRSARGSRDAGGARRRVPTRPKASCARSAPRC